jgi:hypothetical protein
MNYLEGDTIMLNRSQRRTAALNGILILVVALSLAGLPSRAQGNDVPIDIKFDTTLELLDLSGGPFPLPLASDPTNALGDSIDGYGYVDSEVTITLSSQRAVSPGPPTTGWTFASQSLVVNGPVPNGELLPNIGVIDPDALDGELFYVDSFFDVFFDITVTDVDARPGRDYAGQPDGASVTLPDNGPTPLRSFYTAIFDKDAPNFGLFPPPAAASWTGMQDLEMPLGGDINVNGEDDKIKIDLASISAGDENRTFIELPDGTVINEFDTAARIDGDVLDESDDPPFTIGATLPNGLPDPAAFGGPTTATSNLQNPILPEPATMTMLAVGALAILRRRRRVS